MVHILLTLYICILDYRHMCYTNYMYLLNVDVVSSSHVEDVGNEVVFDTRIHLDNVASLPSDVQIVDGDTL